MQTAKPGSHTVWDCKYHIVWVTKYRFAVLGGDVGFRARELLREIALSHSCRSDKPGSCPSVVVDPTASIGLSCGAISQRQELSQASDGVSIAQEAILGAVSMGQGILGCFERKCHR